MQGLHFRTESLPWRVLVGGLALVFTWLTPTGWIPLLLDGSVVLLLLAAAAGYGVWATAWLGLSHLTAGKRFCTSAALGSGAIGLVTLGLGLASAMNPIVAWLVLAGGVVCGGLRLRGASARQGQRPERAEAGSQPAPPQREGGSAPWLVVGLQSAAVAPLWLAGGVLFAAALLPPGVLWAGEGFGYDVLEYHLQVPREYYEAGRIAFLPHNVYAQFPQQAEIQYYLLMQLKGGPYRAALAAQLLHAAYGVLAVVAIGAWTRVGWQRVIAVLAAGSVPWLTYVGVLAYVENFMLFYGAVAAGLLLDQLAARRVSLRIVAATGAAAGLAGNCKYTAMALVTAALGVAWLAWMRGHWRRRLLAGTVYGATALAVISPWLIRNALWTGNPVYPFAYGQFDGAAWSAEQAAQWKRGHAPPSNRMATALRETIGVEPAPLEYIGSLFGPALFLLALFGAAVSHDRAAGMLATWALAMLAIWMALTHMPGRFLIPIVVPLGLLTGRGVQAAMRHLPGASEKTRIGMAVPFALLLIGAVWGACANSAGLWRRVEQHDQIWRKRVDARLMGMVDATRQLFIDPHPLNARLPAEARIYLVGPANVFYIRQPLSYHVVFNRDPWLAFASKTDDPREAVAWLARHGYTHVAFDWTEIQRLRGTYGFEGIVTPAWVDQLRAAGLRRAWPERFTGPAGMFGFEVFAVR